MHHHFHFYVIFKEINFFHTLKLLDLLFELFYCVKFALFFLFVASNSTKRNSQILMFVSILIINDIVWIRKLLSIHIAKLLIKFFVVLDHLQVLKKLLFILLLCTILLVLWYLCKFSFRMLLDYTLFHLVFSHYWVLSKLSREKVALHISDWRWQFSIPKIGSRETSLF